MPDKEQEKLFAYVTMRGEVRFADKNPDGQILLPDTGKPPAEARQFYASVLQQHRDGRLYIPGLRDPQNAHQFFVGVDEFRAKVHEALGTKNPPPREFTPEMIALSKRMSDELEAKRQAKIDERYKPEWRDFEKRFRNSMAPQLDKLEGLSPQLRADTESKLRELYRQNEKDEMELEEKEPDFYDPKTQGKHYTRAEYLLYDADLAIRKSQETQKAKDLAEQYKASETSADRENDRER